MQRQSIEIKDIMNTCTIQDVVLNYKLLSSKNQEEQRDANCFLLTLADKDEAWALSEQMIVELSDPHFQFLGAQILYQKIARDLHQISPPMMIKLKTFLFKMLDGVAYSSSIVDKLASSAALISTMMVLNQWGTMFEDVVLFMGRSSCNLKHGLTFLERIPEQLRMTNRLSHPKKMQIQEYLLERSNLFADVFQSVIQLNDESAEYSSLAALQSWVRMGFRLMAYPLLVGTVLALSLQSVEKLQVGSKILIETVKATAQLKFMTLAQVDPLLERQSYDKDQLTSFKAIVQFLVVNRTSFLASSKDNPENFQIYTGIIKQILLSDGFMLFEDIGIQMLALIVNTLDSPNLKLSASTFQFWADFCSKIGNMKLPELITGKLWNALEQVLLTILKKVMLPSDELLLESDLKDDETDDDIKSISFNEYRKEAQNVLLFIYEYSTKKRGEAGCALYFQKLSLLLQQDFQQNQNGRPSQLALYGLRAVLEQTVKPYETAQIICLLELVLGKLESLQSQGRMLPPRVVSETLNIIKDCSREIKQKDTLFLSCLRFSLGLLEHDKLCHQAAFCFQVLMDAVTSFGDSLITQNLIEFYQSRKFTKQIILEKTLEGILSGITKLEDQAKSSQLMSVLLAQVLRRYGLSQASNFAQGAYLSLIEFKTLLGGYDSADARFKKYFKSQFLQFANQGLEMIRFILVSSLTKRLPYSNTNELGMGVSSCKSFLRICEGIPLENLNFSIHLSLMDVALGVFDPAYLLSYYPLLTIISDTLMHFAGRNVPQLNEWLIQHASVINQSLLGYLQKEKHDPDIVRHCFAVQESSFLYNEQLYVGMSERDQLLSGAVYCLQKLNEKLLQRKLSTFICLCVKNRNSFAHKYVEVVAHIFAAIPTLSSICHGTIFRVLLEIFEGVPTAQKEAVIRDLLCARPYKEVDPTLKQILVKFLTFALESRQERFVRGVLLEMEQINWRKTSVDSARDLELKMVSWKREYAKQLKENK